MPWLRGHFGYDGVDATTDEIAEWPKLIVGRMLAGERGVLNLGARVPVGVIGIDVDQYGRSTA